MEPRHMTDNELIETGLKSNDAVAIQLALLCDRLIMKLKRIDGVDDIDYLIDQIDIARREQDDHK